MRQLSPNETIIAVIIIAVVLNVASFCLAFPETSKPESDHYARDFSAYYIAEWRLFHNPTSIYNSGIQPGDYEILPAPQQFKYTPSFLLMLAPSLALSYQDAFAVFDLLQVALIPLLAYFVYKFVKDKNLYIGAIVAVIVLFDPLPSYPINSIELLRAISPSYYCGYLFANAHILQVILLVGSLYMGLTKRPWLSALLFGLGFFDPRAALIAVPLLLWYNREHLLKFISAAVLFLVATNLPFFVYHQVGFAFLDSVFKREVVFQMYQYDWIPIYAVISLSILEMITVVKQRKMLGFRPKSRNTTNCSSISMVEK